MEKLIYKHTVIEHPKDVEYFKQYPAPLMEIMHSNHFTNVNATITFFGPMLYFLLREIGAEQVLEIGHAEGYSSFYLANAVKDNATRFGMEGNKYYGIDIVQTDKVREQLLKKDLPVDLRELDSMKLTPETFKGVDFDVIFQDGCHDTEHVLYEMATMYPQLKPGGYWIFHDAAGPAEEAWHLIVKDKNYQFESLRFITPYGLGIMRKIEGIDPEKRYWKD
jgi:predicted O-methyltransferase YrrM